MDCRTDRGVACTGPGRDCPSNPNITPPETAQHGRAVELNIRLRDGDEAVKQNYIAPQGGDNQNFTMIDYGDWVVSNLEVFLWLSSAITAMLQLQSLFEC